MRELRYRLENGKGFLSGSPFRFGNFAGRHYCLNLFLRKPMPAIPKPNRTMLDGSGT